jgi:hypothetical protein
MAFILAINGGSAELEPVHKLTTTEFQARHAADLASIQQHRLGLSNVLHFIGTQPEIFPQTTPRETRLLRREEKEVVWGVWQRFLDYTLALDSTARYHADWWRLKGLAREDAFLASYAALLANYHAALEFIRRVELNPELDKVFNDAVPELGLPAGTYAKLKYKFLNVQIASQFAANEVLLKTFAANRHPELRVAIRADADYIWRAGHAHGRELTARNALKVVQQKADAAWLPIQTGLSEWMGDTKVYRPSRSLISAKQIKTLTTKLAPGDVLLERREWYLSNVGLPGFWSHAALYLGTPEERQALGAAGETVAWVRQQGEASGDFETLVRLRFPEAYQKSLQPQEHEHVVRVIEAISEGVSFTTLEHSADCDSLAALRPRLSSAAKARALFRAFAYAGRPYDFNFDFATDAELVCTELVYKSYEPASDFTGLKFPLVEMLGRKVTPANEIAKQFDAQQETTAQQFDLVIFLDGLERKNEAIEASVVEFRKSWQRPKWHVLVQE